MGQVNDAFAYIAQNTIQNPDILLIGYSAGGDAALMFADEFVATGVSDQCFERGVKCTPMSRQQNDVFISGLISFLEIDLSRCLVIECLMQSPIVIEVHVGGQAAACLTG